MPSTPLILLIVAIAAVIVLIIGVDLAYSYIQQRRLNAGQETNGISSSGRVTHRGSTSSFASFAARTVGGTGSGPEKSNRH